MFSKMISTLLILANLWVTAEGGLIDGLVLCTSEVAALFELLAFCASQATALFEWFLLTAFLAAFVTALCATDGKECKEESSKEEAETEDANTLHLPELSQIEVEDDDGNSRNVEDMNGNRIRRMSSSLREIWGQKNRGSECVSSNQEEKNVDDEQNNPISMQTSTSDCTDATFTDAIAETLVRDLLKETDNDDIEQVLEDDDENNLRPNAFSGFWRQLPGKGDTAKVRNIWNLEDTLNQKDQTTVAADSQDWKKKDSLQLPKEYWLSDSLKELAKTCTLEKLMDENSNTNPSSGGTSTMHEPTEDEHGANWVPPKAAGLGFEISEGCLLNNPWLENSYMRRSKAILSDESNLSIQRPLGLDFQILDRPMIGRFSPPCCPGIGKPLADPSNSQLPDTSNSNASNTLSENLGLLGIWVGSEDNFLQIQVPLMEQFAKEDKDCTPEGFFPQARVPLGESYDVGVPLVGDHTHYTNNHFASFQEEKEQHQDILQRYT